MGEQHCIVEVTLKNGTVYEFEAGSPANEVLDAFKELIFGAGDTGLISFSDNEEKRWFCFRGKQIVGISAINIDKE